VLLFYNGYWGILIYIGIKIQMIKVKYGEMQPEVSKVYGMDTC